MYAELKADAVSRVTREIRKAIPDWKKVIEKMEWDDSKLIHLLLNRDEEVRTEIENLVRIIIEEAENE